MYSSGALFSALVRYEHCCFLYSLGTLATATLYCKHCTTASRFETWFCCTSNRLRTRRKRRC